MTVGFLAPHTYIHALYAYRIRIRLRLLPAIAGLGLVPRVQRKSGIYCVEVAISGVFRRNEVYESESVASSLSARRPLSLALEGHVFLSRPPTPTRDVSLED